MLMLSICRLSMANDNGSNSRKRKAGKTWVTPLNGDDNRSETKAWSRVVIQTHNNFILSQIYRVAKKLISTSKN